MFRREVKWRRWFYFKDRRIRLYGILWISMAFTIFKLSEGGEKYSKIANENDEEFLEIL